MAKCVTLLITWLIALSSIVTPVIAAPTGTISTDPNFKVAFIGDTGAGTGFAEVLNLISQEGAQLVVHQGDYGYGASASTWAAAMNGSPLGSSFPYLGSDGNHENWIDYEPFFRDRLGKMGISIPANLTSGDYTVDYKGLKMVFLHEKGTNVSFIDQSFNGDNHIWKICSWHHNMSDFQVGGKGDDVKWPSYQTCQKYGAIVATGHEHSYSRTYTLDGIQSNSSHHVVGTPDILNLSAGNPGSNFVFVSGIGGNGIRAYMPSHDADSWWASIFTSNRYCKYTCTNSSFTGQDLSNDILSSNTASLGTHGALFITFNVDGNPYKAVGYFKTTKGNVIDSFTIYADSAGATIPPSAPTATPTNIPGTTPGAPTATGSAPTITPNPTITPTPYLSATPKPTFTPTNTPGPTSLYCDQCGYCKGKTVPDDYDSCVQCRYGAAGDSANPDHQLVIASRDGYFWTIAGCVESEVGTFVQKGVRFFSGAISGITFLLMLYGGFLILTSQGDPDKIYRGRTVLTTAIIAELVVLFSVFIYQTAGGTILNIPGLG